MHRWVLLVLALCPDWTGHEGGSQSTVGAETTVVRQVGVIRWVSHEKRKVGSPSRLKEAHVPKKRRSETVSLPYPCRQGRPARHPKGHFSRFTCKVLVVRVLWFCTRLQIFDVSTSKTYTPYGGQEKSITRRSPLFNFTFPFHLVVEKCHYLWILW